MAWTLKDIPTFYIFDGKKVDYTEDERKALLTEWKSDDTRIEDEKIVHLRKARNVKLVETDWVVTMHKELGTNIPTAMKTYRQALRDITNTYTSLDDVVWPEKP